MVGLAKAMAFVHYRRAVSPLAVASSACKRDSCLLCCYALRSCPPTDRTLLC